VTSIVIHAAQIIDGTGGAPLSGQDVGIVVIDGQIGYVGELSAERVPGDAHEIRHTGTIVPGMIDMHAHVSFEMTSPRTPYAEIADPVERIAIRATDFLRRKLTAGVTTMRAMSERSYVAVELRDAVSAGLIAGPDVLAAGLGVRAAHGWGHTGTPCTGPWEVRAVIRQNAARGCDLTKLFLTNNGALNAAGQIPSHLTDTEIRAGVDESLRAGLPAAAHCMGGPALATFIDAGGATVEHGFYLTDEDLRRMRDHDATLVCTMGYLFDRQDISAEPDALAAREVVGLNYARAITSGVSFVLGSDDGSEGVGHEIVCLSRHGVSTLSAITAATSNAARVLGLDDRGAIAPGLRADLVALAGDPLLDPEVTGQISWVMKRGVPFSPQGTPLHNERLCQQNSRRFKCRSTADKILRY
jgi:imidazolonepropionase-like amidohydrolase